MADKQPTPSSESKPGPNQTTGSYMYYTMGTNPIGKKQPWRGTVQLQEFVQPDYFQPTPSAAAAGKHGKIRLLAELDSKSR